MSLPGRDAPPRHFKSSSKIGGIAVLTIIMQMCSKVNDIIHPSSFIMHAGMKLNSSKYRVLEGRSEGTADVSIHFALTLG